MKIDVPSKMRAIFKIVLHATHEQQN